MTPLDERERFDRPALRGLLAVARLVRVPNLFTAPPDVILGAALVAGLGRAVSPRSVGGVAVASVLLYAAGTTLNDYFDAAEDARHRPERPIPSGAVSRTQALALGLSLLVGGVAAAALVGGPATGAASAVVALLVVGYDAGLKGSLSGYLAMGGARGTNVLLGTTVAASPGALPTATLLVPVVVALYIAAVTFMAEGETEAGGRAAVGVGGVGAGLAVAGVAGTLALRSAGGVDAIASLAFLLLFLAWVGRPLSAAFSDPVPPTIGPAVGACVLGLVLLNAAFAGAVSAAWAVAAAACFPPAFALSRAFDVS